MNPTICRTCGKAEWNHVCRGAAKMAPRSKLHHPPTTPPVAPPPPSSDPSGPQLLTDAELRPYYNEYQRRKMQRLRQR